MFPILLRDLVVLLYVLSLQYVNVESEPESEGCQDDTTTSDPSANSRLSRLDQSTATITAFVDQSTATPKASEHQLSHPYVRNAKIRYPQLTLNPKIRL